MIEPSELYEMLRFAGIFFIAVSILLVVCSVMMWYKKEKLSKLSYTTSLILTIILYCMNIFSFCDSYLEKGIFEIILFVSGVVFVLTSIFLNRKGDIIKQKIAMNIATIIGFIVFVRIILVLNYKRGTGISTGSLWSEFCPAAN